MAGQPESASAATDERLTIARQLVTALEANDEAAVSQQLQALAAESTLYQNVGHIAREVHEHVSEFLSESGLATLAQDEAPDTRRRLDYVIELTNDAAHRTLASVERAQASVDSILNRSHDTELDPAAAMAVMQADVTAIRSELSEIMMAQSFQDLSGQIITRAIALVTDIESRLVDLVRLAGPQSDTDNRQAAPGTQHGEGPRVAGTDNEQNLANQDEVDDLLKSLGF